MSKNVYKKFIVFFKCSFNHFNELHLITFCESFQCMQLSVSSCISREFSILIFYQMDRIRIYYFSYKQSSATEFMILSCLVKKSSQIVYSVGYVFIFKRFESDRVHSLILVYVFICWFGKMLNFNLVVCMLWLMYNALFVP